MQNNNIALRDYFAGLAMQGLIALPNVLTFEECAAEAYNLADAMLAAREAGQPAEQTDADDERYERLEQEHLGDPEKQTGIYALKSEDGWIAWHGGENPAGSRQVTVRLRNGDKRTGGANSFCWDRFFGVAFRGDIVAYRIAEGATE